MRRTRACQWWKAVALPAVLNTDLSPDRIADSIRGIQPNRQWHLECQPVLRRSEPRLRLQKFQYCRLACFRARRGADGAPETRRTPFWRKRRLPRPLQIPQRQADVTEQILDHCNVIVLARTGVLISLQSLMRGLFGCLEFTGLKQVVGQSMYFPGLVRNHREGLRFVESIDMAQQRCQIASNFPPKIQIGGIVKPRMVVSKFTRPMQP